MCGIAGVLRLDGAPVDCADVKRMTDAIAHRGPDGEGQWCEGPVGLGHRRLAIVDLSSDAAQPMHSFDGRFVITYNGEVYNFRELRRDLERGGSRFCSNSDTEVVLEAVIRWGIDEAIRRLNGMFAFAIWDRREQRLILGRDRYGIKPLYFRQDGHQLLFASEPKSLSLDPTFRNQIDTHALAEYLTFQDIYSDRTFTQGVRSFPPAHWMCLSGDGRRRVGPRRFWDWPSEMDGGGPNPADGAVVEEIQRLLSQAIRRQMMGDVGVGAFLSGGLDSAAIVSQASQHASDLRTYTIGFDTTNVEEGERHFDERDIARRVAQIFRTQHADKVLGPGDVIGVLPRVVFHQDEPRAGQSYPNYHAASLASMGSKVVLAGTGGDELFAGYPWRYSVERMSLDEARTKHFRSANRVFPLPLLRQVMAPVWGEISDFDPEEVHRQHFDTGWREEDGRFSALRAALHFDRSKFLRALLAVDDRQSMAFGLETRVPFLDNDLVDFVACLPLEQLLSQHSATQGQRGFRRADGKALLRRASAGCLPTFVVDAPKQGFAAPDTSWWRGVLRPLVSDVLSGAPVAQLNQAALHKFWTDRRDPPNRSQAWSIAVVLETLRTLPQGSSPSL